MFARLSAAILLALPLLAVAQDCDTSNQHCCNSLQDANTTSISTLLSNLLAADVQGVIGQLAAVPSLSSRSPASPATNKPCAVPTTTS
ncbi:hypothetical protein H0H92_007590, partial [Tricholoma furcatifolium]